MMCHVDPGTGAGPHPDLAPDNSGDLLKVPMNPDLLNSTSARI